MSETSRTTARIETITIDGDEFTVEAEHVEAADMIWTDLAVVNQWGEVIAERVARAEWLSDSEVVDLAIKMEDRAEWASSLDTALRDCGWTLVRTPLAA